MRATAAGTRVRMTVEERRRQLLELGIEAFADLPYDEVSTDEIAAAAGISRGLLFHYFSTKRDFYKAVLEVVADELVQEASSEQEGAPYERLVSGVRAYFEFVERRATPYVALLRGGVGTDPMVQEVVESTRRRFIEIIRSYLPTSQEREPLLRTSLRGWIGMQEALALDWADHRDLSIDDLVALSVRAFAHLVPGAMELVPPEALPL